MSTLFLINFFVSIDEYRNLNLVACPPGNHSFGEWASGRANDHIY